MAIGYCSDCGEYGGHKAHCPRRMASATATYHPPCPHANGWYVNVKFWIFTKYIYVCSDCGHHHAVKGETR